MTLFWGLLIVGSILCAIGYGDSSTTLVSVGLGLLALSPAFFVLKRVVAKHLPTDHEYYRAFSLPLALVAMVIALAFGVILAIDPWILEPLFMLLMVLFELLGD